MLKVKPKYDWVATEVSNFDTPEDVTDLLARRVFWNTEHKIRDDYFMLIIQGVFDYIWEYYREGT